MRISHKLAVTHGLMSLLLVGLVYTAKLVIDRIDADFDTISDETFLIIEELDNFRAAGLRIVSATNEYAFILSTSTDEPNPNGLNTEPASVETEFSEDDELEELAEGIEAFTESFARYSQLVAGQSSDGAYYQDDIGTAGAALISSSSWMRLTA